MSTRIRLARPGDEADIVAMIHELALFERAPEQCTVTESQISAALFGDDRPDDDAGSVRSRGGVGRHEPPVARCFLAEVDGDAAAMALWFRNFSTWDGVAGIHLEDLFVRDRFRRRGLARALLAALAAECVAKGYSRLDWAVLDWNTDAIALYDAVGGRPLTEWIGYRVSGAELSALAAASRDVSH